MSNKTTTECQSCGQSKTTWHDHCASCGTELTHVFSATDRQYRDALHMIFAGGYGEFIDGDEHAVLCRACAAQLCVAHPWISRMIGGHR